MLFNGKTYDLQCLTYVHTYNSQQQGLICITATFNLQETIFYQVKRGSNA